MENRMATLTDTQVTEIYNKLETMGENTNKEKLSEAKETTESTEYNEVVPTTDNDTLEKTINTEVDDSLVDAVMNADEIKEEKLEAREEDYKSVFEGYGIEGDDLVNLMTLINEYRNNKDIKLYDRLPEIMQSLAESLASTAKQHGEKYSKESASRLLLNDFINDAEINRACEDYQEEMNKLMMETNEEFKILMKDRMDDIFNNIEEIRKEDPSKAKTIEDIKKAYDAAEDYSKVLEFLNHISIKKITKAVNRYEEECIYFNKKVSNAELKVPDISKLYDIINRAIPNVTELQIKKFIIALCKSCYSLDPSNVVDIAYMYKLINNITVYEYSKDFDSDDAKKIFGNIYSVMLKKII